jgi:hypothetical protein
MNTIGCTCDSRPVIRHQTGRIRAIQRQDSRSRIAEATITVLSHSIVPPTGTSNHLSGVTAQFLRFAHGLVAVAAVPIGPMSFPGG